MSENSQRKLVKKKKVTVRCIRPFRIGLTPFSGYCPNIILTVEDIAKIIESKSMVEEVLSTGETVPLDFSNYNTYNGPTDVNDESVVMTDSKNRKAPVIRQFTADGKEIIPENKPKFGGGFRKEPKPPAQILQVKKEEQPTEKKETTAKVDLNMSVKQPELKQQEAAKDAKPAAVKETAKPVTNTEKKTEVKK